MANVSLCTHPHIVPVLESLQVPRPHPELLQLLDDLLVLELHSIHFGEAPLHVGCHIFGHLQHVFTL